MREQQTKGKKHKNFTALHLFLVAFFMYVIATLPIIIRHDGLFFYFGDYNVQQVPFYILAHRAVRSGNLLWSWNLDLGGSFIGDFAFYLAGSPFFWITIPFPESALPYMMPFLMALKYGTCAVCAYQYIKSFVQDERSAMVGGLLYAFCGFNGCNIVFNHFTDAVAFFPLFLLCFDRLILSGKEDGISLGKEKWIQFALMTAFMSILNYYFFFGQVIFIFLYWIVRFARYRSLRANLYALGRGLSAGVLGLGIAAFYLNLALAGVSGNNRLGNFLNGYDLLVYPSAKMYFDMFKSAVMIPDNIGKGSLFYTDTVKNASLAIYLPMFGISGIAAYFMAHRKDWKRGLLICCMVIAGVPFLNAVFSLMNAQYYARWYYMPILFMALMTVQMLEREDITYLRKGTIITIVCFLLLAIFAALPTTDENGVAVNVAQLNNSEEFWANTVATAAVSILLLIVVFCFAKKQTRVVAAWFGVLISGTLCTMVMLLNGASLISDYGMEEWKLQMLDTSPELPDTGFYRIETDSTSTNYEMVWGYPTIHCFLSTVPSQIIDFYDGACGLGRTVESAPSLSRPGLRALLSGKFYLENTDINTGGPFSQGNGIFGYQEYEENMEQNGFRVYENLNYIPMGFTFDYFVRESTWDSLDKSAADLALVQVLILPDEVANAYTGSMKELSSVDLKLDSTFAQLNFAIDCIERANTACTYFETSGSGFTATTSDLAQDRYVFFSVPNCEGFRATVDGIETEIVTADYGLMAIPVEAGVHEIEVTYLPAHFYAGLIISVISLLALLAYGIYSKRGAWQKAEK